MSMVALDTARQAYFTAVDIYTADKTLANRDAAIQAGKAYTDAMIDAGQDPANSELSEDDFFTNPTVQDNSRRRVVRLSQGIVIPLFTNPTFARYYPNLETPFAGPNAIDPVYDNAVTASIANVTIDQANVIHFTHSQTGNYGSADFNGYAITGLTGFTQATVISGAHGNTVAFADGVLTINLEGNSYGAFSMDIQLT